MSRKLSFSIGILSLLGILIFIFYSENFFSSAVSDDEICLLLPKNKVNQNWVKGWINAAEAEGLHLVPVQINEFLRPKIWGSSKKYAGVILPDQLYQKISSSTVAQLKSFVKNGGHLMLVYDAGMFEPNQLWYQKGRDLFSGWTGINMDRSSDFQNNKVVKSYAGNRQEVLEKLEIPFGKYMPLTKDGPPLFNAISTYAYGPIQYPHFKTKGSYQGQVLLQTPDHILIAGKSSYGLGQVLFVNLPLTYLWSRTDGVLMNAFLKYFAQYMLHLPILSSTPKGIGGLILNIHVDSNAAFKPLEMMKKQGFFENGPFSVHITAGPYCDYFGDNKGFNVEHSMYSQNWVKFLQQHGHEVGSHGGYMHNYFGFNVNENNAAQFSQYLSMNDKALERVLGKAITTYSAPVGNHPSWTTRYLEAKNFSGYYSTSHAGAGPIQNYINGKFDADGLYAFPALPLNQYATFEEFARASLPKSLTETWLLESLKFVSEKHVLRLIYFHPPGLEGTIYSSWPNYIDAFSKFLAQAKTLAQQNKFQWYTMHDFASFLNNRKKVTWRMTSMENEILIQARHPVNLKDQTWFLQKNKYLKPNIVKGNAVVKEDARRWIVISGAVPELEFRSHFK